MRKEVSQIEQQICEAPGVLDPAGVHHEFKNGGHGRKLDLEAIPREAGLYKDIIEAQAEHITELYPRLPDVIVGIARGGNRLAHDIAKVLDGDVVPIETEKNQRGKASLPYLSRLAIRAVKPEFVLIIDDVGTTGKSITPVAKQLLHNRMKCRNPVERIEAYVTWQRQSRLPLLERRDLVIPYTGLITTELKTYPGAAECYADPKGYCARGDKLLSHGGQ